MQHGCKMQHQRVKPPHPWTPWERSSWKSQEKSVNHKGWHEKTWRKKTSMQSSWTRVLMSESVSLSCLSSLLVFSTSICLICFTLFGTRRLSGDKGIVLWNERQDTTKWNEEKLHVQWRTRHEMHVPVKKLVFSSREAWVMNVANALISDRADFRGATHPFMSSVTCRAWAKASSSVHQQNC